MNPEDRKVALFLADRARKGGWTQAAYADVLGALGILTREQAGKVARETGQDPDPNYESVCPAGTHPAEGNVIRDKHSRMRCTRCSVESKSRAKLRDL